MIATITPTRLSEILGASPSAEVIDVRTPMEFRQVHATMARSVPIDQLDAAAIARSHAGSGAPVYLLCKSGARARQAADRLAAVGMNNAVVVDGGTDAWVAAGLPVVRGKKSVSLERQVRMAAGSLVLAGSVLALTVHPAFAGVSAFVGAGLVFAGVTDWCGMGLLLAKMPWNR